MAESRLEFGTLQHAWKLAEPKRAVREGVTLASTTDEQKSLNAAVRNRPKETTCEATYTLGRSGEPDFDGAIEHVEPLVSTDGSIPRESIGNANPIPFTSAGEYAAVAGQYNAGVEVMKQYVDDFDEVLSQDLKIPQRAIDVIQRQLNGPAIAYHLGLNRNEAVALRTMSNKQIDQYVTGISARIMKNGTVYLVAQLHQIQAAIDGERRPWPRSSASFAQAPIRNLRDFRQAAHPQAFRKANGSCAGYTCKRSRD